MLAVPAVYRGTNAGATSSAGEALSCAGSVGASIWFEVPIPNDLTGLGATLTVTTAGSSLDTVLALYLVEGSTATEVVCSDDYRGLGTQSLVRATVSGGEVYRVQLAGFNNATGAFTLTVLL